MPNYVAFSLILTLLAAVALNVLMYYGNRKTFPWYVQITCFIAWLFPFTIIFILPLDLTSSKYDKCNADNLTCQEPFGYIPTEFLTVYWGIVYWTSFTLTWFVIPIMTSFTRCVTLFKIRSGEFTFWRKIWAAIKENLIFYAILGSVGAVFIFYAVVVSHIQAKSLIQVGVAAANAYGLFLVMFMLGYGIVEVPRSIFNIVTPKRHLRLLEKNVTKLKEATVDSEAELYDVARQLAIASKRISLEEDHLRKIIDKLLEQCPLALQEKTSSDTDAEDVPAIITLNYLVILNARLKKALYAFERDKARFKFLLERAFFIQDLIENEKSADRKLKSVFLVVPEGKYKDHLLSAYWWYYIWIKPISLYLLGGLCAIASIILVWSETTFQINSVSLSIPALMIQNIDSPFIVEVTFIMYMCVCTYSTLFKLKLLDFYQMEPEHHTDEATLLFVGGYLCRLNFPLCYNFLNMISLADVPAEKLNSGFPTFIQYLGPAVKLTPLLGEAYNEWLPYSICVISFIFLFHLHNRILVLLRLKDHAVVTQDHPDLEEGRAIIDQARKMEERRLMRTPRLALNETETIRTDSQPSKGSVHTTASLLEKYKGRRAGSGQSLNIANKPDKEQLLLKSSTKKGKGGLGSFSSLN